MKGVLFLAFEAFVIERFGEAAFYNLLDTVGDQLETQDPYVGPLTYPDADLMTLLAACTTHHHLDPTDLQRELGAFCFGFMATRYTWAMVGHRNYTAFLRTLERTIHPRQRTDAPNQIQQLIPGSHTPLVTFDWSAGGANVTYRSERALCALAEGLLVGGARYFGEQIELRKQSCRQAGHDLCTWRAELS